MGGRTIEVVIPYAPRPLQLEIHRALDAKRFDGHVFTTMRMKRDGTLMALPHVSAKKKKQM